MERLLFDQIKIESIFSQRVLSLSLSRLVVFCLLGLSLVVVCLFSLLPYKSVHFRMRKVTMPSAPSIDWQFQSEGEEEL